MLFALNRIFRDNKTGSYTIIMCDSADMESKKDKVSAVSYGRIKLRLK